MYDANHYVFYSYVSRVYRNFGFFFSTLRHLTLLLSCCIRWGRHVGNKSNFKYHKNARISYTAPCLLCHWPHDLFFSALRRLAVCIQRYQGENRINLMRLCSWHLATANICMILLFIFIFNSSLRLSLFLSSTVYLMFRVVSASAKEQPHRQYGCIYIFICLCDECSHNVYTSLLSSRAGN